MLAISPGSSRRRRSGGMHHGAAEQSLKRESRFAHRVPVLASCGRGGGGFGHVGNRSPASACSPPTSMPTLAERVD